MSKSILLPATADSNTNEVAFVKTLPGQEDTALAELIKQHIEAENAVNQPQSNAALRSWYRSGPGPHPTQGGVWVINSVLTPLGSTPSGIIDYIKYNYDRSGFGGWTSKISVALVIRDPYGTQLATTDITASGSNTINVSGENYPANCQLILAMKVGEFTERIFKPPYIDNYDCIVYYA